MKTRSKELTIHAMRRSINAVDRYPTLKKKIRSAVYAATGMGRRVNANDLYHTWALANYPNGADIYKQRKATQAFKKKPLISVVTPVYNTDHDFLRSCIESVLGQTYENWELILVDDKSPDKKVRDIITEYSKQDSRIKGLFNKKNMHISGATNEGVKIAKGEFISLLDHDDILWPNALYEVAKVLNDKPDTDFIYSDEDKVDSNDFNFQNPFFKPDWNPDFLYSVNYITHFSTIRKSVFEKVGMLRSEYNGAQDWDLFLRVSSHTKAIEHIPKVLYSWRISNASTAKNTETKPYVVEAQKAAIQDDLRRKGYSKSEATVKPDPIQKNYWTVSYKVKDDPLVSIVIPTKNQLKVLKRCIDSVLNKTTYINYEIIIVDTGSDEKTHRYYKKIVSDHIKVYSFVEDKFSYAKSCNYGASKANGEYLVMLNNDTEVIAPSWIEDMLGYAQRESTGFVGCKLLYPEVDLIQHAGIGLGLGGVAANLLSMLPEKHLDPTQNIYMHTAHNVSAVTAACFMISKKKFDRLTGFDPDFRITYNDVDICLRGMEQGWLNVYLPNVKLYHYESISLGKPDDKKRDNPEFEKAKRQFVKRWKNYIAHDPHLNPNFSRSNAFMQIDVKLAKDR